MTMSRYLRIYLTVVSIGLALVAGFNFAVDPYATFRWNTVTGFNDQKTLKRDGGRVNKGIILQRYPFDVLFFGSSSTETGLNPLSPQLAGLRAFNASLSYTSIPELNKVALFAAQYQTPQTVIIGLDLMLFQHGGKMGGDFADSAFADAPLLPVVVKRLLFQKTLLDSFGVVIASRKHIQSTFPQYGNHDPSGGKRHELDMLREFRGSIDKYFHANGYLDFEYGPENIALLDDVIARYQTKGTKVILFITPYHIIHRFGIALSGAGAAETRWKQDLMAMVDKANDRNGPPVRLWDFSAPSPITTEPIPAKTGDLMQNYWDSNHYTAAVGELILARVLERNPAQTTPDFGYQLTPSTLAIVQAPLVPSAAFKDEAERLSAVIASQKDRAK